MSNKNITVDHKKCEISKKIVLSGVEWSDLQEKATQELMKNLKLDGFRKGKVPANIAKKHISKPAIYEQSINKYLNANLKSIFEELQKENDKIINVTPLTDIKKISDEEVEISIVYPLDVDFSRLSFENINVKFDLPKTTKENIDTYIQEKLNANALQVPLKGKEKTKLGDTVTLNYKGFVNEEAFDGGEAKNFDLKLGSKTFIDTFEEQLMGKPVGYKGEVVVTFPKEYPVDKLAGQKATFDVEIVEAKRPEEIKLTDENVSLLRAGAARTVVEAKDSLKWILLNNNVELSLSDFLDKYVAAVLEKNEISLNDRLVAHQADAKLKEVIAQLKQQEIKFDEYLKVLGKTEAEFKKLVFDEEKQNIKFALIAQHLIKEVATENNEPTEQELNAFINATVASTGLPAAFIKLYFLNDENNKKSINSRLIDRRNLTALLLKADAEKGKKLVKIEQELNDNLAKIAEEWTKRAEELKQAKEKEKEQELSEQSEDPKSE
ncbi:trigger factor [Mycoplasmopsis phocirhinis]|uniref:Trigger factor n=1 Tax=Mycoplasmopsis phocirhinis TaxID=142650 RepID=A0A4P6MSG6_9BACT|nr:trigger factor [Mycoplasmopsis phocirhinis]QBF34801.1 trigger factor [Mycoplasmopsis phocirhinis]